MQRSTAADADDTVSDTSSYRWSEREQGYWENDSVTSRMASARVRASAPQVTPRTAAVPQARWSLTLSKGAQNDERDEQEGERFREELTLVDPKLA